jgi:hypothetical protein
MTGANVPRLIFLGPTTELTLVLTLRVKHVENRILGALLQPVSKSRTVKASPTLSDLLTF